MILNIAKKIARRIKPSGGPGRNFWPRKDDVFLVSYPKSGNTWMRFLLANLLYSDIEPITFNNINLWVPDIYWAKPAHLQAMKRRRIIKSHEYFEARYRTVIYVVRDPRDVAVSYYYHLIRVNQLDPQQDLALFVKSYTQGTIDGFGTWGEHVGSWLGARKRDPRFLLIRYEDLLEDTGRELAKIADLLDLATDASRLEWVVEQCGRDNMRKLEKSRDWTKTGMPKKEVKKIRRDMNFVRSAQTGDGRAKLSEQSIELITQTWGPIMADLGYG